jgi:hypothetical protein
MLAEPKDGGVISRYQDVKRTVARKKDGNLGNL